MTIFINDIILFNPVPKQLVTKSELEEVKNDLNNLKNNLNILNDYSENNDHYLFSYGSLTNDNSVSSTLFGITLQDEYINSLEKLIRNLGMIKNSIQIEKKMIPCRINGIKREWNFFQLPSISNNLTKSCLFLGADITNDTNYTCNGSLIPLSESQIKIIDKRETGYIRKEIDKNNITLVGDQSLFEPFDQTKKIYFYSNNFNMSSSNNFDYPPIVQSYVDICMNGFISIDKKLKNLNYDFTNEFVNTTYGWDNSNWINDRICPRRPFVFVPNASIINSVLNNNLSQNILNNITYS